MGTAINSHGGYDLKNRVTLVTGASRGIGQAVALKLGQQGAVIVGTATTGNGADSISRYLEEERIQGAGIVLNVNDNEQINSAIQIIGKKFGEIEILVNNAGITRDNLLLRMKDNEWDEIMETNLKSVFRLSRVILRSMIKVRYGRIINISSVVGMTGNPGQANYAAAKAGLHGFSKSLAREVGSRNITVNCVAPGFIDTDMTRALTNEHQRNLVQHIPLGRLGYPEEIASAVAFLASSSAGYITGTTLHVNGGMYMD